MKKLQVIGLVACLAMLLAFIGFGCAGTASGSNSGGGGGGAVAATVQMTGSHSFSPINVTVPAGKAVQWQNIDTAHHTVASDTSLTGFNSDPAFPTGLAGGESYTFTVPAGTPSGTILYYHCEFHGAAGNGQTLGQGMAGSITVQ